MWLIIFFRVILKWGDSLKILKYKKKPNGKYSVFLDDGRELVLFEEVILKHSLLLTKIIEENDLLAIYQDNLSYDVYYAALKSIQARMKSVFELKTLLRKKEYPEEFIEQATDRLIKQGYLNDKAFAKSYINMQIMTTSHGPNRIKNDLIAKKVPIEIIEEVLVSFTDKLQLEKIHKLIKKAINGNKTKGGFVLKQKISNDLKIQGFDYHLIQQALSEYSFAVDKELAKKEYDKLYKKYSSKYEGYELKNKIREKMYQKGLLYEEE